MSNIPSVPEGAISPPLAAALSASTTLGQAGTSTGHGGTTLSPEALSALEVYKVKDTTKVVIRFQPTGNAPILKQKFRKITASEKFQTVIQFLRKELGLKGSDSLFLYINAAFSPAPDDTVGNLYKCFGTEGMLIVNYSSTVAWG